MESLSEVIRIKQWLQSGIYNKIGGFMRLGREPCSVSSCDVLCHDMMQQKRSLLDADALMLDFPT
jgi:hypothetical protein